MSPYAQLLKNNPNYALLWYAQVISLAGDWFNTIVLSTLVAKYSDGSGLAVSLFLMSRFLPPLVVGPFGGVLVDRYDRQRILIYSNILRTGIVLLFLLATTPSMLWLIYALTVAQFTVSAVFEPAHSALTPSLVKKQDLVLANTLASITWSSMLALGAIVGGTVGAVFGPVVALIFDAATFAVAGFLISRIKISEVSLDETNSLAISPLDTHFRDGLRYLAKHPGTTAALLIKAGSSLGNVDTLMTIYATQVFVRQMDSELSLGIMFSAFGVGAILGPLLLNRINDSTVHRMRRLVIVGFLFVLSGWILLGVASSLTIVCLAFVTRAMGGSANWTYSTVIIQKSVPDRFLGRMFSLDMVMFQMATVISIIAHGTLIDLLSSRARLHFYVDLPRVVASSQWRALTLADLVFVPQVTVIISLLPLLLWSLAVFRMERQQNATLVIS